MPLTSIQRMVVEILRPFRDEHDFVAGGAALNQEYGRLSDDMDIFHDRRKRLPDQVNREIKALQEAEFSCEIIVADEYTVEAIVRKYSNETRVQWMDDEETSRRFFPAVRDDELGFKLHQADNAINKVLCASRRQRAPRDAVDIAQIVQHYASLGPLVWAAVGKDPQVGPEMLLQKIRGNIWGYSHDEIVSVRMVDGSQVLRDEVRNIIEPAIDTARRYCSEVAPNDHIGHLFVDNNEIPIEADKAALENNTANAIEIREFNPMATLPV